MIVSKTPLRVSFLGGGTDFPWFFEEHGGAVLSAPIDKYIYINFLDSYDSKTYYLKYSRLEVTQKISGIDHPIFKAVLGRLNAGALDISVMADIPSGNGLASSSAFTVGLINGVLMCQGIQVSQSELAKLAIEIELDVLHEPIGVQDQLAASIGGLSGHKFSAGRQIESRLLLETKKQFPYDLFLIKVGVAPRLASEQTTKQREFVHKNRSAFQALTELRDLTLEAIHKVQEDPRSLHNFVREGWKLKAESNPSALSEEVRALDKALAKQGALATKLLGAGGGGFMLAMFDRQTVSQIRLQERLRPSKVLAVGLDLVGARTRKV